MGVFRAPEHLTRSCLGVVRRPPRRSWRILYRRRPGTTSPVPPRLELGFEEGKVSARAVARAAAFDAYRPQQVCQMLKMIPRNETSRNWSGDFDGPRAAVGMAFVGHWSITDLVDLTFVARSSVLAVLACQVGTIFLPNSIGAIGLRLRVRRRTETVTLIKSMLNRAAENALAPIK